MGYDIPNNDGVYFGPVSSFDSYQTEAMSTSLYPQAYDTIYPTLGLVGEAGEIAEKVKKSLRGDGQLDKAELLKELGDVLWYLTAVARDIGYSLEDVAQANLDKLRSRKERGVIRGSGDNR